MWTMSEDEKQLFEMKRDLDQLRIEVRSAEKWIDRCKDMVDSIQEMIFDYEDRMSKNG